MRVLLNMSMLYLVLCCAGCTLAGNPSKNDWLAQANQYPQDDGNASFTMANVEGNIHSHGGFGHGGHCGHR